jgi:hypothetical protein
MQHRKQATDPGYMPKEDPSDMDGEPDEIDLEDEDEDEKGPVEERKELIEDLFEKTEAYVRTNVELIKIKVVDKVAEIIASLISRILIITIFLLFFLMINIGLALWLGEVLGHNYYGFFIVAGLYALLGILLNATRNPLIKHPIINSIITQVLKKKS